MSTTLYKTDSPRYRHLFQSLDKPKPLRYFLLENLLEARHNSNFPTNFDGPDEDVNIYLAELLTAFLTNQTNSSVVMGAEPMFLPPAKNLGRRNRADWYRKNADHRLIMLGIFNRGDNLRRRNTPFGFNRTESRNRDLITGQMCYTMAANLLEGRYGSTYAVVEIMRKLGRNFSEYVGILAKLATDRLGLGAQLNSNDLSLLIGKEPTNNSAGESIAQQLMYNSKQQNPVACGPAMDQFLDQVSDYRKSPSEEKKQQLLLVAHKMQINLGLLLQTA